MNLRLEISFFNRWVTRRKGLTLLFVDKKEMKRLEMYYMQLKARLDTEPLIEKTRDGYISPIPLPNLLSSFDNPILEIKCLKGGNTYLNPGRVLRPYVDKEKW